MQKKSGMNGNRFFLDTNITLYILNGDKIVANYLFEKFLYTSIISEIELLSFSSITPEQETEIKKFLNEFKIIPLDQAVKDIAIKLKENII